ncbi:MAG: HAMP domain-containing histidine kinase [Hyphomicrobium sp.]|nr:HAMP domain-containing histidine kinase [Hyphomicrobium sp.]
MTLRELFKRTQLRSAALSSLLFASGLGLFFFVVVLGADDEVEQNLQSRVLRTRDALISIDRRFGFEELVSVVTEEAESVRDADSIFLLIDQTGKVQAGNVPSVRPFEGWGVLERSRLPGIANEGTKQDRFHAIWTPVSKGTLLVGRSDREARQLKTLLLQSLGLGLMGTAALVFGAGMFLARRTQARIDAIGSTLSAVSSGKLDQRILLTGSDDDLDAVASQINDMLGQLEKLIENVNQSSTDIAHDLKRPLTRLRQRLELALEARPEPDELGASLEKSIEDIDGIVATFDALLNIAQLQAGDRRSRFTDVDVSKVLRDLVEAYEAVIADTGYVLNKVSIPAAEHVHGDAELLTQLFSNLIENVLQHTPSGTKLDVSLIAEPNSIVVTVSDNGPGIPATEADNVLRRFYRLERARSGPGHGLGLNLVSAIADLHSAKLELVDNRPGLKVVVQFPRRPARI